jgi:hypothetical protein
MLPLVALSAYIHPQDYDFSWAVFLRENSFRGTYGLAYLTQGGRYVANFLALLTPIPLDPSRQPLAPADLLLYRLAPATVMLGIVVAAHVFLGSIFDGIRTRHRWVMVFGITLMYFGTLEDHAEVLYWFNGNMQYLVPLATLLLFLAYLARMATDAGRRNLALAALWGALTVGCNETVLLTVNLVLLAVCTRMFMTADPRRRDFLTLFGVILACSLVAVLAPGNAARDGMTSFAREKDLLLAVYKSLNRSLANTLHWVPVTAVTGLLLTEFVQRKGIRLKPALREIDVRWAALLAGACVIAAYFPNA